MQHCKTLHANVHVLTKRDIILYFLDTTKCTPRFSYKIYVIFITTKHNENVPVNPESRCPMRVFQT